MMYMQPMNPDSQRKIMYASHHWLRLIGAVLFFLLALFVMGIFVLAAAGLTRSGQNWKAAGIGLASSLPFWIIGLICWTESRAYMASSPAGLEFHGFGYRLFCPWQDLEAVRIVTTSQHALDPTGTKVRTPQEQEIYREVEKRLSPILPLLPQEFIEVLYLSRPVELQRAWWAKSILSPTRKIRLTDFHSWRATSVGRDIRRFAPQLVDYRQLQGGPDSQDSQPSFTLNP